MKIKIVEGKNYEYEVKDRKTYQDRELVRLIQKKKYHKMLKVKLGRFKVKIPIGRPYKSIIRGLTVYRDTDYERWHLTNNNAKSIKVTKEVKNKHLLKFLHKNC